MFPGLLYFLFPFNKIIRLLILSDFFLNAAFGLLAPVFAIFILQNIRGGDASVAGIAAGIYWILKSVLQIPIGKLLDLYHGERDDYKAMIWGMFISSIAPLGFLFASQQWHLYILQVLLAVGMALEIPSRAAIFTRHIDKEKEAETWGLQSSSLGLAAGIAGIVGGIIANTLGFPALFILVSLLGMISTLLLVFIRDDIAPRQTSFPQR